MKKPKFDLLAAHRYFSAYCFNQAWELIEKPSRAPQEDEELVRLNQASIWHWTQREDCTDRNLSIGYWQASRIYALLERAEEALRYARLCLEHSQAQPPFYLGYAYETLARAEALAGNPQEAGRHLSRAFELAAAVADAEERQILMADLESLL